MVIVDHRPRVAAQRRERMRARLLESALRIAATRGPAAVSIDALVTAAEVSRGTFYKYFDAPGDLLADLGAQISGELIRLADPIVKTRSDPAERIALGLMIILRLGRAHPVLGGFIGRAGWPIVPREHSFVELVAPDVTRGLRQGRFLRMHTEAALNLVAGAAVGAMHALSEQRLPRDFEAQVTAALLRGLGLEADDATRMASIDFVLPELEPESLLRTVITSRDDRQQKA